MIKDTATLPKGQGRVSSALITSCLVTVCWILRWESSRTQEGDLTYHYLGLLKDGTKYPTCSTAMTHGEFLGDELLLWGDATLCGCTISGLHAPTRHRNAGMSHLGSSPQQKLKSGLSCRFLRAQRAGTSSLHRLSRCSLLPLSPLHAQHDEHRAFHRLQDTQMFSCNSWLTLPK